MIIEIKRREEHYLQCLSQFFSQTKQDLNCVYILNPFQVLFIFCIQMHFGIENPTPLKPHKIVCFFYEKWNFSV